VPEKTIPPEACDAIDASVDICRPATASHPAENVGLRWSIMSRSPCGRDLGFRAGTQPSEFWFCGSRFAISALWVGAFSCGLDFMGQNFVSQAFVSQGVVDQSFAVQPFADQALLVRTLAPASGAWLFKALLRLKWSTNFFPFPANAAAWARDTGPRSRWPRSASLHE